jgi:hypothetical protein
MKKSIFASALCFENRYIYILAADCQSLEVLDTAREDTDKMFDLVPLSFSQKVSTDMMRPLLLPLDETEIAFLHCCQDSQGSAGALEQNSSFSESSRNSCAEAQCHEHECQASPSQRLSEISDESPGYRGDFLFLATAGSTSYNEVMCLSVQLQEVRCLQEVTGMPALTYKDSFSSQQFVHAGETVYIDGDNATYCLSIVNNQIHKL